MSSERAMDKEKYSEEENAPTALDDYDTSSENHSLKIDFPSGGTSLEKSQYIVTKISEIGASSNFKVTFHYLKKLEEIVKSNPKDNEIFYCLIEGITVALQSQEDYGNEETLNLLMEKIISLIQNNIEENDYLAALSDAFLLAEEVFISNDLLEDLEKCTHFIINFSLEYSNNIILRTSAADAVIITLSGFGSDWNYEKTKQYGKLLRGLLPPSETKGIFASILIKGLAEEIKWYGDMHEFGALERSLDLMKEVYTSNLDFKIELIEDYTNGLVSALRWFGEEEEDYTKMTVLLKEVAQLTEENGFLQPIKIAYANALRIALDLSGVMDDLDTATKLAKDLYKLSEENPDIRKVQVIASIGLFKAATWAGTFWETGFVTSLLSDVGKIHERFPDDNSFKIQLGRGLFNLTKILTKVGKKKIIEKILVEIRKLHKDNPDLIEVAQYYSKSIVNAIFLYSEVSESKEEIFSYLSYSEILVKTYPEDEEIILNYSKALVNVIRILGKFGQIDEMEKMLDTLKDFSITSDSRDVLIRLAKAYIDAITAYGEMTELEKIIPLYNELINWAEDDTEDIDFQILLAKAIVNIVSSFGKNGKYTEMEIYLDDLRELVDEYPELSDMNIQLAKGLSLAVRWSIQANNSEKAFELLNEINRLQLQFADEFDFHELYARASRRLLVHSTQEGKNSRADLMLENLRALFKDFPTAETIQLELARGLSYTIIKKSNDFEDPTLQPLVMEMKGLRIQFPNNEKLEEIFNAVEPLFKD